MQCRCNYPKSMYFNTFSRVKLMNECAVSFSSISWTAIQTSYIQKFSYYNMDPVLLSPRYNGYKHVGCDTAVKCKPVICKYEYCGLMS